MAEALFDRVDPDAMPEHLQGKTPKEVNKYWADRENQLKTELQPAATTTTTTQVIPPVQQTMTQGQALTLIQGAKMVASSGKDFWARFLPEVEAVMSRMTPAQQMDASIWSTVYDSILGSHAVELVKESVAAATAPPSMESSSASVSPAPPRQLNERETKVVDGLRRAGATAVQLDDKGNIQRNAKGEPVTQPFSSEAYLAAEKKVSEGKWPLTFNNY